jgi:hypothetical protein
MKSNTTCCHIWCGVLDGGASPQQLQRWLTRASRLAREAGGKQLRVEIAHHPDDGSRAPTRLRLSYTRNKSAEENAQGIRYEDLHEELP